MRRTWWLCAPLQSKPSSHVVPPHHPTAPSTHARVVHYWCVVLLQSIDDRYNNHREITTDAVISLDADSQLTTDEVGMMRKMSIRE